jgi:hypothetical protein
MRITQNHFRSMRRRKFEFKDVFSMRSAAPQQSEPLRFQMRITQNHFRSMRRRKFEFKDVFSMRSAAPQQSERPVYSERGAAHIV